MKNLLTAALPALALLALGGCATTGAVTSTEDDGVYYSSKDRTTVATAPASASYQNGNYGQTNSYGSATTQAPAVENSNPDYQGGTQAGTASNTGSDYYDDSYNSVSPSGFGQPYTGPGVSSYNYTPSWSVSPSFYGSPYGYGSGLSIGYGYGGFGGYSPFGYGYGYPAYAGFYDPFYSPFYSPFYGYGSGFSLGFGYGFGYPYYGGYGYPGYAYGYPYGGGYYGDYGYGYGGARNYVYKQNIVNGGYPNGYGGNGAIMVGRRESRAVNAVSAGRAMAPGNAAVGSSAPSGRQANGGAADGFNRVMAPGNPPSSGFAGSTPGSAPAAGGRAQRFEQATANPNSPAINDMNAGRGWGRANGANPGNAGYNQPRPADMAAPAAAAAPEGRRGGFFRGMFSAPAEQGGNMNAGNQGGFSQPQRSFSQPQRSFSQPADRGFSQPQRSFQPAPQPSFGGGGGGGGSFGGGGGGGGGRRGR